MGLKAVGISTPHAYELRAQLVGGYDKVGYRKRDMYNKIHILRKCKDENTSNAIMWFHCLETLISTEYKMDGSDRLPGNCYTVYMQNVLNLYSIPNGIEQLAADWPDEITTKTLDFHNNLDLKIRFDKSIMYQLKRAPPSMADLAGRDASLAVGSSYLVCLLLRGGSDGV
ncbi:hypothetical protein RIF29_10738 [Crotalaria pallida]|uniref:Uncharacterized protein n=1 Tax=Crotalaria pallida TaxID=3830 RepID=A0AAN9FT04_CROPI